MKSRSDVCTNALCGKKVKSTQKTSSGCCSPECDIEMQERMQVRKKGADKKVLSAKTGDMDFTWFSKDGW